MSVSSEYMNSKIVITIYTTNHRYKGNEMWIQIIIDTLINEVWCRSKLMTHIMYIINFPPELTTHMTYLKIFGQWLSLFFLCQVSAITIALYIFYNIYDVHICFMAVRYKLYIVLAPKTETHIIYVSFILQHFYWLSILHVYNLRFI